jgi:hypothetical protein
MSLEQAITENTAALRELAAAITAAAARGATTINTVIEAGDGATEEKKGRGRPKKETPAADSKPADPPATQQIAAAEDVDPFADEAPAAAPAKTYTLEDVRKAFIDLAKTKKEAAKVILGEFTSKDGKPCAQIAEIVPSDYPSAIAKIEAAAKG